MKPLQFVLASRSPFIFSDAIIEAVIGLVLFMVAAKVFGLGHLQIYAFGGSMYGFAAYVLLQEYYTFSWTTYEEDGVEEDTPERMNFLAAILALFLPMLAVILLALLVVAGIVSLAFSPFLPKKV